MVGTNWSTCSGKRDGFNQFEIPKDLVEVSLIKVKRFRGRHDVAPGGLFELAKNLAFCCACSPPRPAWSPHLR